MDNAGLPPRKTIHSCGRAVLQARKWPKQCAYATQVACKSYLKPVPRSKLSAILQVSHASPNLRKDSKQSDTNSKYRQMLMC